MDAGGTLKTTIIPPAVAAHTRQLATHSMPWGSRQAFNAPKGARERHKMVVMLAAAGWTGNQIAQSMGYTPARVSVILTSRHPDLLAVRKEAAQKVMDNTTDLMLRFRAESGKSLDVLVDIRDNKLSEPAPPALRRLASRDILDRAGYSPIRKQINLDMQMPGEEVVRAAKQLAAANEVDARRSEWTVHNPDGSVVNG